ncbi:MAG: hypothetical protein IPH75_14685 [bacterium]|nr:hypothetical protein [bacterium]
MTANRIKKILLTALVAVALYIWWGNLQLLTSQSVEEAAIVEPIRPPVDSKRALVYQPPKINPFVLRQVEEINEADTLEALPSPVVPESAHEVWQLVGIVKTKKRSTAVFSNHEGKTTVCAVGDSLGRWEVQTITDKYTIASQENWRDTLWLRGIERK